MYSMTGYGRAEYCENGVTITVELKTVNNRNFDLNSKMPRSFLVFDDLIRKTVAKYVLRGRIDLFVNFSDIREKERNLSLDIGRAKSYYEISKRVSEELGLVNDVTVTGIMRLPDVVTDNSSDDVSEFKDVLEDTVKKACENLNEMRGKEGEKICVDLLRRMDVIEELRNGIFERAPLVVEEYRQKLKQRVEEALKDVKYDEARLLNEVAFYTDKVNIDEELTRLSSHIHQFREIIRQEGSGKKADFLMQEFNREANTVCSKSNDIEITRLALSLKNEIEKVREQVQNLE
ncbi:MAG: YicC/YloC family endoribonuclease [Candidatus Borkfalkiaceae bacterium]|nr:YicC/YloC family endoribonuclease [Christensenellaceae bacterium]